MDPTALQRYSVQRAFYSATAFNERLQRYSVQRAVYSATAFNGHSTALQRSTGSLQHYSAHTAARSTTVPIESDAVDAIVHVRAGCRACCDG